MFEVKCVQQIQKTGGDSSEQLRGDPDTLRAKCPVDNSDQAREWKYLNSRWKMIMEDPRNSLLNCSKLSLAASRAALENYSQGNAQ